MRWACSRRRACWWAHRSRCASKRCDLLSHVTLGCDDFDAAFAFWAPLMAALGARHRFTDPSRPWAGWEPASGGRPLFIVGVPFDGAAAVPGNGGMVAFDCPDRATVDRVHGLALSLGGTSEGAPGLRPEYHAAYYGAYFRDPSGNKVALACHRADEGQPVHDGRR